jgi:uncharacterized protein involved in propanediol utilization
LPSIKISEFESLVSRSFEILFISSTKNRSQFRLQHLLARCSASWCHPSMKKNAKTEMESRNAGGLAQQGQGAAIGQYGELFQGMVRDKKGDVHRCLVSLPCSKLRSRSRFTPGRDPGFTVVPARKKKAIRAVEIALDAMGAPFAGGRLVVESDIPEAKGLGSSTADCIAAVMSAADALGKTLCSKQVAEMVVRAEIASGNVMFENAVLFAHREGRILEDYFRRLPRMTVLGFDTAEDAVVDTLSFTPAEYSPREIENFRVLSAALRRAIYEQDAQLLGCVATASAEINQRFLPKALFREISKLARSVGVLGVAVAHSGTVAGILLDSMDPGTEQKIEAMKRSLAGLGIDGFLVFNT